MNGTVVARADPELGWMGVHDASEGLRPGASFHSMGFQVGLSTVSGCS